MKNVLFLKSSPFAESSHSNKLAEMILTKLKDHGELTVHERDLTLNPPPLLTKVEFGDYSDKAIEELATADIIVIGVAIHNFHIPGVLKAWIDQVCVAGKTFSYQDGGPFGLIQNKKVYLALASGGSVESCGLANQYLQTVLGFIGLTDTSSFFVYGTALPGLKENALERAFYELKGEFCV